MRPLRTFAAAAVATGVLAGPVLACGGGWMGVNLVVNPGTKAALRQAYFAAHPPNRRAYGVDLQVGMLVEAAFVAELP